MHMLMSSAAQCEPRDPEAQWDRTSSDVSLQTSQGVTVQQGHGRETHQYVHFVFVVFMDI